MPNALPVTAMPNIGRPRTRWLGLALMLYPYIVWQTWLLYLVGAGLCAAIVFISVASVPARASPVRSRSGSNLDGICNTRSHG